MADSLRDGEMAPTSGDPCGDGGQLVAAARAAAKLARQVNIPLSEINLSLPQYRVLAFLDEGGAAPSDLAGRLSVSRPSITALMDGLLNRNLVERHSDPMMADASPTTSPERVDPPWHAPTGRSVTGCWS